MHQTIDTERLKRVKKNRQVQLQRWHYLETEYLKKQTKEHNNNNGIKTKRIKFSKDAILLEAISRNDIKEVKELLDEGVNPNASTIDGLTGLHQCAIDDFREIASLLLKYEANVNARDSDLWTPLHAAATCNNGHMFILLCKYGADILALNNDGNMPYEICENTNVLNVIEKEMSSRGITQQQIDDARMVPEHEMLQDIKAFVHSKDQLNQLDSQGAALIHIACSLGYCEVVQTLLEMGANYSLPDKDGWLPIHLAACWSHVDIVEFLVVFGADIDIPNASGDTIFDLCEPDVRERLFYVKDNLADIQKNYTFSRVPSYKSLRRSRGSSVRRTSVRQKNMLSKKEAKGEFMVLTKSMASAENVVHEAQSQDGKTHMPSTIEEGSDVDSLDTSVNSTKVTVNSLKTEDHTMKQRLLHSHKNTSAKTHHVAPGNHSPPAPRVTPSPKAADNNHSNIKPDDHMTSPDTAHIGPVNNGIPVTNAKTNSDGETLDKPKYLFSSPTANWDNAEESKGRRSRKCCCFV